MANTTQISVDGQTVTAQSIGLHLDIRDASGLQDKKYRALGQVSMLFGGKRVLAQLILREDKGQVPHKHRPATAPVPDAPEGSDAPQGESAFDRLFG